MEKCNKCFHQIPNLYLNERGRKTPVQFYRVQYPVDKTPVYTVFFLSFFTQLLQQDHMVLIHSCCWSMPLHST
jgi:hypothetical protein